MESIGKSFQKNEIKQVALPIVSCLVYQKNLLSKETYYISVSQFLISQTIYLNQRHFDDLTKFFLSFHQLGSQSCIEQRTIALKNNRETGNQEFVPVCHEEDGSYVEVQCHYGTGYWYVLALGIFKVPF